MKPGTPFPILQYLQVLQQPRWISGLLRSHLSLSRWHGRHYGCRRRTSLPTRRPRASSESRRRKAASVQERVARRQQAAGVKQQHDVACWGHGPCSASHHVFGPPGSQVLFLYLPSLRLSHATVANSTQERDQEFSAGSNEKSSHNQQRLRLETATQPAEDRGQTCTAIAPHFCRFTGPRKFAVARDVPLHLVFLPWAPPSRLVSGVFTIFFGSRGVRELKSKAAALSAQSFLFRSESIHHTPSSESGGEAENRTSKSLIHPLHTGPGPRKPPHQRAQCRKLPHRKSATVCLWRSLCMGCWVLLADRSRPLKEDLSRGRRSPRRAGFLLSTTSWSVIDRTP